MDSIDLRNVTAIPDESSGIWYYTPKKPGIARNSNGQPQFNLLSAGPVSFLQITGSWGVSAANVDSARSELCGKLRIKPDVLDFRPAPERVDNASLLISDGSGGYSVLKETVTSGIPPYHATFNIMLTDNQLEAVKEALNGKRDQLALCYNVTCQIPAIFGSAERTETSETFFESRHSFKNGVRHDGSRASASNRTVSNRTVASANRESAPQTEKISAMLDAADWPSALQI